MPTNGSRCQALALVMSAEKLIALSYGSNAHVGSPPGAPLATPTTVGVTASCLAATWPPAFGGPGSCPTKRIFLPIASDGDQPKRWARSVVITISSALSALGRRPAASMSDRGDPA